MAALTPTSFNPLLIRRRLGRENWAAPYAFGPDGWILEDFNGNGAVIITCAPVNGDEWVHASMTRKNAVPSYDDLKLLHRAVFGDGWAYQVFAPPMDHVNIHEHALHLWGRLDGRPALPDFTDGTGSI